MTLRNLGLLAASLVFAFFGYFFFAIVVAIYAGLIFCDDKMYFAQGISAHIFGIVGAVLGVALAAFLWRLVWAFIDARQRRRITQSKSAPPAVEDRIR